MEAQEDNSMLDVHAPHESVHGWRDFLLHLVTITIGLVIALGLEGCVEWQHHRHLVHEAEHSLHTEIQNNANNLAGIATSIHAEQASLKHDLQVLDLLIKDHKLPPDQYMAIDFRISGFDSVSWNTAQSTGALAYMDYASAQEYSGIYHTQDVFESAEQQTARDAILSLAPFLDPSSDDKSEPTSAEAVSIKQHIEIVEGQLLLLDTLVGNLNSDYKKFLAAHPN
jgi:hypothetical protein